MPQSAPILSIRDIEIADAALINRYWAETDQADLLRMGELARPDPEGSTAFIRSLCEERPEPNEAEEGILIWCVDSRAIGYSTLKDIRFKDDAQIHLHMWEKESRGKGIGAVLFCLTALEFMKRFRLKALYCQPKTDNPMPNRMLRKIGFAELPPVDYGRGDGSTIRQSRYLIAKDIADRFLYSVREKFKLNVELRKP